MKTTLLSPTERAQSQSIQHQLWAFSSDSAGPRAVSFLITASPGVGKSTLVRNIMESIPGQPYVLVQWNLSQMRGVEDLHYALLNSVARAHNENRIAAIFLDEVDADLPGNGKWYPHLLGPMEDSSVFVRGIEHPLGRCVFLLVASSGSTSREFAAQVEKSPKGVDFLSRIDGVLEIGSLRGNGDSWSSVRRAVIWRQLLESNGANKMDLDIARHLVALDPPHGARSMRKAIQASASWAIREGWLVAVPYITGVR